MLVMPTRSLVGRREIDDGRLFLDRKPLQSWLQKEQMSSDLFYKGLAADGILIDRARLCTLGAGTDMASGQVKCIVLNARHPILCGELGEVSEIYKNSDRNGRPDRPRTRS